MGGEQSELWEDLMLAIEEGHVVPMVGRDLLTVDTEQGPKLFHQIVAEKLALELNVPIDKLPPGFDANDVVCASGSFHGDPTSVTPKVVRILRSLKVPPPESLRLLAEIPEFDLFLTTTFDTLLEEALTAVRGRPPAVVAFPPASSVTDFDEGLMERNGSLVFHMLGRVSASASFAVTEGQVLEQMHDFMAGPRRPEKLVARLRDSHLLILGVSFPDWLARFLLRLARAKPLWDSRPMMEIIAEGAQAKQEFAVFLGHFSPQQSRLYTGGSAVDFVRELHRRWKERHPQVRPAAAASSEKPDPMERGSIFLSYAHEDHAPVFKLADTLAAAGLEVWVDRRINPGDDFRDIIRRNIRDCCAFVPVLSRNTQSDDLRWFRSEWAQAVDQAKESFGTDRAFLFPIVVDGTPMSELNEMRRDLFARSAVTGLGGVPPTEFIASLDRAQKMWRKQHA